MTKESYELEIENLVFDSPLSERPKRLMWSLPEIQSGESLENHVSRLRRYKQRYFEQIKKLEDGRSLAWL